MHRLASLPSCLSVLRGRCAASGAAGRLAASCGCRTAARCRAPRTARALAPRRGAVRVRRRRVPAAARDRGAHQHSRNRRYCQSFRDVHNPRLLAPTRRASCFFSVWSGDCRRVRCNVRGKTSQVSGGGSIFFPAGGMSPYDRSRVESRRFRGGRASQRSAWTGSHRHARAARRPRTPPR